MNAWIAKLGAGGFSNDDLDKLKRSVISYHALNQSIFFEYRSPCIHYVSISTSPSFGGKNYNHRDEQNKSLLSFSGLLVGKGLKDIDYRSARTINENYINIVDITAHVVGQYALIKADENCFECLVDCLGAHKVFYYSCPEDGTIIVSNRMPFMKLFKPANPNISFLVERICLNNTYGYTSSEKDVLTLPESGLLTWSRAKGLQIGTYASFSRFFTRENNTGDALSEIVSEFKGAVNYLTRYHDCVLPLSGGFDSRLILDMFWGANKQLKTFTYPDSIYDVKVARSVASAHGVEHQVLVPAPLPSLDELHDYARVEYDFIKGYNVVFQYIFSNQIKQDYLNDNLKVMMYGHGGDTSIKKIFDGNLKGEMLIIRFVEALLSSDHIFTAEGYEELKSSLSHYFKEKYLPYLDVPEPYYRMYMIHFQFEHVRPHGCYVVSHHDLMYSDVYLPFVSELYINTIFTHPVALMFRQRRHSRYHQLEQRLTNGKAPAIHFTDSGYWQPSFFGKAGLVWRKYRDRTLKNLYKAAGSKYGIKFSRQVRTQFFNQNRKQFEEIIYGASSSGIWDYIDRNKIMKLLAGNKEIAYSHITMLLRLLPVLKSEMDRDQ